MCVNGWLGQMKRTKATLQTTLASDRAVFARVKDSLSQQAEMLIAKLLEAGTLNAEQEEMKRVTQSELTILTVKTKSMQDIVQKMRLLVNELHVRVLLTPSQNGKEKKTQQKVSSGSIDGPGRRKPLTSDIALL